MPVFKGSTSGSIAQVAYNIPNGILTFSLVNTSGASNTVNLYISDGVGSDVRVLPMNLTISAGDSVFSTNGITVSGGNNIFITVTGSIDYYFSIE